MNNTDRLTHYAIPFRIPDDYVKADYAEIDNELYKMMDLWNRIAIYPFAFKILDYYVPETGFIQPANKVNGLLYPELLIEKEEEDKKREKKKTIVLD